MDTNNIRDSLRQLEGQAREWFQRVSSSERDRRLLWYGGIGGSVLLLYIIFQFFSSGSARLERKVEALQSELRKIDTLRSEYIQSKRAIEQLSKNIKTGDKSLISLVEETLVDSQVDRGNFSIKSRTPTSGDLYEETSVDVELKKIPLNKMVDVLYKIQTTPVFVKVTKFRPQIRFDNPDLMDASFRVSTFKLNEGGPSEKDKGI